MMNTGTIATHAPASCSPRRARGAKGTHVHLALAAAFVCGCAPADRSEAPADLPGGAADDPVAATRAGPRTRIGDFAGTVLSREGPPDSVDSAHHLGFAWIFEDIDYTRPSSIGYVAPRVEKVLVFEAVDSTVVRIEILSADPACEGADCPALGASVESLLDARGPGCRSDTAGELTTIYWPDGPERLRFATFGADRKGAMRVGWASGACDRPSH